MAATRNRYVPAASPAMVADAVVEAVCEKEVYDDPASLLYWML
jgi:hypothetical protein